MSIRREFSILFLIMFFFHELLTATKVKFIQCALITQSWEWGTVSESVSLCTARIDQDPKICWKDRIKDIKNVIKILHGCRTVQMQNREDLSG